MGRGRGTWIGMWVMLHVFAGSAHAAPDYVSLTDIASEFAMQPLPERADPKELGFGGETHTLVVKLDSRQTLIDGVRHWLSFPVKADADGQPTISKPDLKSTLKPALDPATAGKLSPVKTIVFDPGHGGYDKGGQGPLGFEKEYVLDVVKRARTLLEARGVKVVQSRLGDSFVRLTTRPVMTKNYEDPIFVSVHFNSAAWRPAAEGIEIFAIPPLGCPSIGADPDSKADNEKRPGDPYEPQSFVLANTIHQTMLGKLDTFDRGVKRARYAVLRNAKVPSILIEGGFLTNPEEAKKIHSKTWRQKYATALADALQAYMALANEGTPAPRAIDLDREPTDEFVPED